MISEVQEKLHQVQDQGNQEPGKFIHEKECLALMMNMKIGDEKTDDPGDSLSREIKEITIGSGVELTQKIIHPSGRSILLVQHLCQSLF